MNENDTNRDEGFSAGNPQDTAEMPPVPGQNAAPFEERSYDNLQSNPAQPEPFDDRLNTPNSYQNDNTSYTQWNQNGYPQNSYNQNGYPQNGQTGSYPYGKPYMQNYSYPQFYTGQYPYVNPQNTGEFPSPVGQPEPPKQKPPKKKMEPGLKVFLWIMGVLVGGFILCFSAFGIYTALHNTVPMASASSRSSTQKPNTSSNSSQGSAVDPNAPGLDLHDQPDANGSNTMTAAQIYAKVAPSVVGVVTYEQNADVSADPLGQGSGIVMSDNGYILTNSHVISDSKSYKIKVVLQNSQEYAGTVVGFDTRTDLAVIKIDATGLTPATFGNSDQLAVGDWVLAIGNPGGLEFSSSLTRGIVSAVNRTVGSSSMKYIQTDAAINPGNSGGALVNMYGQVVGINTAKIVSSGYEGMGFAIPIKTAQSIVNDLKSQGYVSGRVRLGITGQSITQSAAQTYQYPQGVMIREISGESSFSNTSAQKGDIITKVNGTAVTDLDTLFTEMSKYKPGDTVTVTLYRPAGQKQGSSNSTFDVKVTLLEDKGETQQTVSQPDTTNPFQP